MSTELRARGAETTIRLTRNGVLENLIKTIRDLTIQMDMKTITDGYLGEATMRFDDIFDGVSGSFNVVPEGQEIFVLDQFIINRARRITAPQNAKINLNFKAVFPGGDRPRAIIQDLKFDAMAFTDPGRDQYIAQAYPWKSEDVGFVLT